jgi:hypothetical protein
LVWFGLVWFGLVWFGLVWFCLLPFCKAQLSFVHSGLERIIRKVRIMYEVRTVMLVG